MSGEQSDIELLEDNNVSCISDKPIKIIKMDTTHEEIINHIGEITKELIGGF